MSELLTAPHADGNRPGALATAPGRALAPAGGRPLGPLNGQIPFHPLLDLPKPRTRAPMVLGLVTSIMFFGGFAAWAVMAPLAEAAIAPGQVKVEGTRRTIQHLEGGAIRELLVRDGDRVARGQVLARLDDIQAASQVDTQQAQRWALLAQDARLTAEAQRVPAISFPAELLASSNPRAIDAVAGQTSLFNARTENLRSQLSVLEARIAQQRAVIASATGQLEGTRRQLDFIRQEERMRSDLTRQGLGRLPELLAVQRARAGLEGSIEDFTGQIARANATVEESERSIRQITDQRLQEVSTEQRDVRSKLAETEERLRAAADISTRRDIVAPESGTVVNLRVFTVGAVLRPGDPLMDLVPDHDRLVAEVNVQPTDIDVVYPGLQAEVRLPAFRQRLVPYLHGHVTWVAADVTTNEQTRQSYYRAYIAIDQDQLRSQPGVFLTPGMPVEAHVQIGQRSFFRYMVQPLIDSMHRAFREQ